MITYMLCWCMWSLPSSKLLCSRSPAGSTPAAEKQLHTCMLGYSQPAPNTWALWPLPAAPWHWEKLRHHTAGVILLHDSRMKLCRIAISHILPRKQAKVSSCCTDKIQAVIISTDQKVNFSRCRGRCSGFKYMLSMYSWGNYMCQYEAQEKYTISEHDQQFTKLQGHIFKSNYTNTIT